MLHIFVMSKLDHKEALRWDDSTIVIVWSPFLCKHISGTPLSVRVYFSISWFLCFALNLRPALCTGNTNQWPIPYDISIVLLLDFNQTISTPLQHYNDIPMSTIVSQITSLTAVYISVYSRADQRKYQSSASLAFARGIHWWSVNSPTQRASNAENVAFDDVIMNT